MKPSSSFLAKTKQSKESSVSNQVIKAQNVFDQSLILVADVSTVGIPVAPLEIMIFCYFVCVILLYALIKLCTFIYFLLE